MSSKNSKGETYGKGRTRNFACVLYPDSAVENWFDVISDAKLPVFISPYHDKDFNADNTPKKPHYHIMVMFDTVKTKEQAIEFFNTFNGVGCEVVNSVRGYSRYLCHLDNPEKAQYSIEDVKCFGGADFINAIGTAADKAKSIREMVVWINENDVICFSDLFDYASVNRSDWFDCLINSGSYVVKEYIKSRTWKLHREEEK